MHRLLKKWGEAALCVLAIVFAALYTRQDDLRRMAAQNAAAGQDQTLKEAETAALWRRPTDAAPEKDYRGAWRTAAGI